MLNHANRCSTCATVAQAGSNSLMTNSPWARSWKFGLRYHSDGHFFGKLTSWSSWNIQVNVSKRQISGENVSPWQPNFAYTW